MKEETTNKIAIFRGQKVRRTIWKNEWWFSVIDVIEALSGSSIPKRYWSDLKRKLASEGYGEVYEKIVRLKLLSADGKMRETDCANTETMFRIVQSIPSPKAEPFKRWLARVGYERVQEIDDPELATKRSRAIYKAKGYSESWIEKRMRGIAIREDLTEEWSERGVDNEKGYAILTAEITKATFGMTPSEYKKHKSLNRENLRDHMNDIELILTMLGEATTTKFTRDRDSKGFPKLRKDSKDGGAVAGRTRKDIERQGKSVISKENYLSEPENKMRKIKR